jgi:hypothetical protein
MTRSFVIAATTSLSANASVDPILPATLPSGAVLRVSRGKFDPERFAEVDAMIRATGVYLIPAIQRLPGLIAYFAATSRDGVTTQISIWDTGEHGQQMATLPEMRDRARSEAQALGVVFDPIMQFPLNWTA